MIIIIYMIFVFAYGITILAVSEGLSASAIQSSDGNGIDGNITTVGNVTITSQYDTITDASACSQNDMQGCILSIVGMMFSVDPIVTPFAMFNYITILFTLLFIIAVTKEIGIPLLEAIVPF